MSKTSVHTCKDCNKDYASYQSLSNHRSKKHINIRLMQHQPYISHESAIDQSIHLNKKYKCRNCDNIYKHIQSRFKHELKCKIEKPQPLDLNTSKNNIQNINNITNNTTNITNNGTINNTIIINNFNEDNTKYISTDFMKRVLDRLASYDDESLKSAIPYLVENIKFNKAHKENNNVQITNIKSKVAKKYIENKWQHVKKDQMVREMHNTALKVLQNWVEENKINITKKMMDGLKDYTNISPAYKKKVIHEEINLLGYNYYKNHMENQLDK